MRPPVARALCFLLLGALSPPPLPAGETGNVCVHAYASGVSCSEADVAVTALAPVTILEDCLSGDPTTAQAIFRVWVSGGSGSRYDAGLFLSLNGDSALSGGSCFHEYLAPPLEPSPTYGDADGNGVPDLTGGPWWNGEPFEPNDGCGDVQALTDSILTVAALRIACVDSTSDGLVDLSTCTSWSAGTSARCQGLNEAYPATSARCGCNVVETGIPMAGAPAPSGRVAGLAVARSGGDLVLTWAPSCSPHDTDYALYEGSLGDFATRQSVACGTGGATTATITPSPGSGYYLVVPRNAGREGSYGRDGAGAERAPAASACLPQLVQGSCY